MPSSAASRSRAAAAAEGAAHRTPHDRENNEPAAASESLFYSSGAALFASIQRAEKSSATFYWRSYTGQVQEETDTSGNMQRDYIFPDGSGFRGRAQTPAKRLNFAGRRIALREPNGGVQLERGLHVRFRRGRQMSSPSGISRRVFAGTLALVVAFCFVPAASPQKPPAQETIVVRFLDARSGQPLKGIYADIEFYKGNDPGLSANVVADTIRKTDEKGEISVAVPQPIPEHIYIESSSFWWNNDSPLSPAQVLKVGAVVPYLGDRSRIDKKSGKIVPYSSFSPPPLHVKVRPGEIVVINVKMPWWHP